MDYYSVLGPIDPQVEDDSGKFVPGMGYLYKYKDLVEKSAQNTITDAELLFLTRRFDPAILFVIEQARNHSEELIRRWLPQYKFKNWKTTQTKKTKVTRAIKEKRALEIAKKLSDAERWHSHGRGIPMTELRGRRIKLKIDNFGTDKQLNHSIRQYYDLFKDYTRKIGVPAALHSRLGLRPLP